MPNARVLTVILLTLMPWPAVWFGMYKLNSLLWTFFLYHGVCLLPATIWGWRLWLPHVMKPTRQQMGLAVVAAGATTVLAIAAYHYSGDLIVTRKEVLDVMTARGFDATYLLPLSVYFVLINATLEELFWRGVVLNELDYLNTETRRLGTVWTAITFSAWHWLVLRALLHPGWAELAVMGVLGMGFFSSWLYRRTGSIIIPIIWHALVFDLAIIALFAVLVLS